MDETSEDDEIRHLLDESRNYPFIINTFEYGDLFEETGVAIEIVPPSGTTNMEFTIVRNIFAVFTFFWPTAMCNVRRDLFATGVQQNKLSVANDEPAIQCLIKGLRDRRHGSWY
jgi:hypothetical protein